MNKETLRLQKRYIKTIQDAFLKAEKYFNLLENRTQDALFHYHNENSSIPYCIRWGVSGSFEVLHNWGAFVRDYADFLGVDADAVSGA